MRFKAQSAVLSILALMFFTSCSYLFDEKEHQKVVHISMEPGSCLNDANQVLADFFNPDLQRDFIDPEFDHFVSCYQETIDSMVSHTRSGRSNQNNFTAENFELLSKRFNNDLTLNQDQILSYINLKHFLIGGEFDTLSKEEMIFIQDKVLPAFAAFLKNIAPYRAILFNGLKLNSQEFTMERNRDGLEKFKEGFSTLREQVNILLRVLSSRDMSQKIELRRLTLFFLQEFAGGSSQDYEKHLDLIEAFKSLALNDTGASIQRNQLKMLVSQGLTVFEALAQFKFFVRDQNVFDNIGSLATFLTRVPALLEHGSIFKGIALTSFEEIIFGFEQFFRSSAQAHPRGLIPFDKFENLILSLDQSEVITGPLQAKTLSKFFNRFSRKWLIDKGPVTPDLTLEKIDYLKTVVDTWVERQKFVNHLFSDLGDNSTLNLTQKEGPLFQSQTLLRWLHIFEKVSLHQWEEEKKTVKYSKDVENMSYEAFTISNASRTLIEVFVKPYNLNKQDPFEYLIEKEDAQEIYELLRELGVELRFMDSREYGSGGRSFSESNNFSTQIQNDKYMDFFESYEYLSVTFSSGQLSELIYQDIPDYCFLNDEDVLGKKIIKARCFRSFLLTHFKRYFSHLHTIGEYWEKLERSNQSDLATDPYAALVLTDDSRPRHDLLRVIELASRGGVVSDKHFDMGEIRTMVSILHYLQSIFYVFDTDKNNLIEGIELRTAEKHFRKFIVRIILDDYPDSETIINLVDNISSWMVSGWEENQSREQIANFIAPKVFIYLLKYGKLPTGLVDKGIFSGLLSQWGENRAFKNTQASVGDVLNVFSTIAKLTHLSQLDEISTFLLENQPKLLQELELSKVPDCSGEDENALFCRWARVSSCNDFVNGYYFNWMRDNRQLLFDRDLWRSDKQKSVEQTMREMAHIFRPHPKLSTQCSFPPVPEDFRVSAP